jgi:hypothetical protein
VGTRSPALDNCEVEKHCLEHDSEFSIFEWNVLSPDLEPIELLLDEMAVCSINVPQSNLQLLLDAIASAWTNIPVERF